MLSTYDIAACLIEHAEDGYSVNVEGDTPTAGYMVGGYVPSLVFAASAPRPRYFADRWLRNYRILLTQPDMYAGIWIDSETRDIYVDISRNVDDLYMAMAIALAHGELAIWDVANSREIRTDLSRMALEDSLTVA